MKKTLRLLLLMAAMIFILCACSSKQEGTNIPADTSTTTVSESTTDSDNIQEFKLLSAYIELRNITDSKGRLLRTEKHLHYAFETSSGEVLIKEKEILESYEIERYSLSFRIGDENKIIQHNNGRRDLEFIMTEELYHSLFQQK